MGVRTAQAHLRTAIDVFAQAASATGQVAPPRNKSSAHADSKKPPPKTKRTRKPYHDAQQDWLQLPLQPAGVDEGWNDDGPNHSCEHPCRQREITLQIIRSERGQRPTNLGMKPPTLCAQHTARVMQNRRKRNEEGLSRYVASTTHNQKKDGKRRLRRRWEL